MPTSRLLLTPGLSSADLLAQAPIRPPAPTFGEYIPIVSEACRVPLHGDGSGLGRYGSGRHGGVVVRAIALANNLGHSLHIDLASQ
jgi:hypothetical protein